MNRYKIFIWLILTILGLVINVLTTLAVVLITIKVGTSIQNLGILLWLALGSAVAILNSLAAVYYYEKAKYNQHFVGAVKIALAEKPFKLKVDEVDSSYVTDDRTDDSDHQDSGVGR